MLFTFYLGAYTLQLQWSKIKQRNQFQVGEASLAEGYYFSVKKNVSLGQRRVFTL